MAELSGIQEMAKTAPVMGKNIAPKQEQLKMGVNQSKRVELATDAMKKQMEDGEKNHPGVIIDYSDGKGFGMGIHPEGYSNDPLTPDEEAQYQKYLAEKEKLAK